ncbi:hypothetical protein OROGR_009124 [Orobanche gracilis]
MAANLSVLQFSSQISQTRGSRRKPGAAVDSNFSGTAHETRRNTVVGCSYSSNGKGKPPDDAVKDVERLLEEKRRAELSARIASGEFTVGKSRYRMQMLGLFRGHHLLYMARDRTHFVLP